MSFPPADARGLALSEAMPKALRCAILPSASCLIFKAGLIYSQISLPLILTTAYKSFWGISS